VRIRLAISWTALVAVFTIYAVEPAFLDVAESAGLKTPMIFGGVKTKKYILETTGGGAAWIDFDKDGWPDLFLVTGSRLEGFGTQPAPTNKLYRNRHDGTFEDVTSKAGLDRSGWGQGVCAGDFNNDGNTDLFVTYWGGNVLYRNNGDGTFTDVTAKAGLASSRVRWGSGCAFVDYDRDGNLDLFFANYVDFDLKTAAEPGTNARCQYKGLPVNCGPRGLKGESDLLFHNNGDGTFNDVSESSGIAKVQGNFGLGVLTGDFDNDGWPDIYVANDTNPSLLFRNKHDGTFEEIGVLAGCAYDPDGKEQSGMGVAAADFDGDGWLDIFKTNYSDEPVSLYHNTGYGTFLDVAAELRLAQNQKWVGWGCGFLDFDNDSWPDLFIVNGHVYPELDMSSSGVSFRQPRILYRNNAGKQFEDVSVQGGSAITTPSVGRGVAFGDYNNDGLIDIAINNMNAAPSLLRGNTHIQNSWISIEAVGTRSNRSGIGAKVYCSAGKRVQVDEVRSGGSFLSQNDLRVHFGLGRESSAELIRVVWPSGAVDELRNVAANRVVTVREGEHPAAPRRDPKR
jgi:hypothetical protein